MQMIYLFIPSVTFSPALRTVVLTDVGAVCIFFIKT